MRPLAEREQRSIIKRRKEMFPADTGNETEPGQGGWRGLRTPSQGCGSEERTCLLPAVREREKGGGTSETDRGRVNMGRVSVDTKLRGWAFEGRTAVSSWTLQQQGRGGVERFVVSRHGILQNRGEIGGVVGFLVFWRLFSRPFVFAPDLSCENSLTRPF